MALWKLKLGLFLFCIVVLAVANIIYVVLETQLHHGGHDHHHRHHHHDEGNHTDGEEDDDDNFARKRRSVLPLSLLQVTASPPCLDFYNYTCTRTNYIEDSLAHLRRDNRRRVEQLIKDVDQESDVSKMYAECTAYNSLTSAPQSQTIGLLLAKTMTLRSYDDLAQLWGQMQLYDADTPLDFLMLVNPWDVHDDLPTFEQSGLFTDPELLATEEHVQAVTRRLTRIYSPVEALEWAENIVEIEQTLYSIFSDATATDAQLYTESLLQYLELNGQRDLIYDWQRPMSDARFNISRYLLGCKPTLLISDHEWMAMLFARPLWCRASYYLSSLPSVIVKYTLQSWIAYTRHAILMLYDVPMYASTTLAQSLTTIDTERYHVHERGQIDCLRFVGEWMTDDIVSMYAQRYIGNNTVKKVEQLASSIKATFMDVLVDDAWLRKKIENVEVRIGESRVHLPRAWKLTGTFIDDFLVLRRERVASRLLGRRDVSPLPVHVEARYRHQENALEVSVGLLREPLIEENQTRSQFYAQLGAVIGHELAHSIDAIGANFDSHGNYAPVISEQRDRVQTCIGNAHTYNYRTQNEDFADVVGVNVAYRSFVGEANTTTVDERKAFFTAYAELFCTQALTPQQEDAFIRRSTHSLSSFRVNNVVRSIPDFDSLLECQRGFDDDCINLF